MQQIIIILLVCFIGYRVIRRIRSNFAWSALRTGKMGFRIVLLAAVGVIFMVEGGFSAVSVVSDVLGILIGAALGLIGSTMTSYERRGSDLYYRGNVWIGGIVTVLFIGRLAYRGYEILTMPHEGGWSGMNAGTMGSAWTSGLMLIMFAYYIVYYALLMKRRGQAAINAR